VKSNDCTDINGVPKKVTVVDTPGFFDTDTTITNQMVQQTIASQIFNMTSPGVHAFLIVLRIDRFTPEEKNTVDFIKTIFGQGAAQYCIVIFTNEDRLDEGQTIDDFVNSAPGLQELVRNCGNRKFTINNKLNGPALEKKTKQLLQMINQMVARNNGDYYTNAEYQRIEKQRKEEQAKREQAERDRKKAYEDALVAQVSLLIKNRTVYVSLLCKFRQERRNEKKQKNANKT
jgi:GTPase Era involved in 16S rRNA processing